MSTADKAELPVIGYVGLRSFAAVQYCYEHPEGGADIPVSDHATATQIIEGLRTELQQQALKHLTSEGEWIELTQKLGAEVEATDRVLRSSVPDHHKGCTSAVGAVQNYIAELEAEVEAWRERFPQHEYRAHDCCVALKRYIPAKESP